MDITWERNVQEMDITSERNGQGMDITWEMNVQGTELQVRGMYRGWTLHGRGMDKCIYTDREGPREDNAAITPLWLLSVIGCKLDNSL